MSIHPSHLQNFNSTHPLTPANSLCAWQLYNESTTTPAHSDTLLIHVYERIWTEAIVAKTVNNKCTISFCIQCTSYSMLQIGQGSYQATLCCREKHMQHWWICSHQNGYRISRWEGVQSGHTRAAEWQTSSELLLSYDGKAVEQLTITTVDANGPFRADVRLQPSRELAMTIGFDALPQTQRRLHTVVSVLRWAASNAFMPPLWSAQNRDRTLLVPTNRGRNRVATRD